MALAISNIPILTDDVAEEFVRNATRVESEHPKVNFSAQRQEWDMFESKNTQRIEALKASGVWPF